MLLLRRSCSSRRWIAKSIAMRSRNPRGPVLASAHSRRVRAVSISIRVGSCATAPCGEHSRTASSMKARTLTALLVYVSHPVLGHDATECLTNVNDASTAAAHKLLANGSLNNALAVLPHCLDCIRLLSIFDMHADNPTQPAARGNSPSIFRNRHPRCAHSMYLPCNMQA